VSSDFLNLLERLVKAGVDFVIVGGFAGVVHGCTYVTQDVDICCDFSAANLLALQKAMNQPRDREAIFQLEAIKKLKNS
jgi:hypothetical protein